MVNMERTVLIETIVADNGVSELNFSENMVETAATGADADITEDTRRLPRMPKAYTIISIKIGEAISLKKNERYILNPLILNEEVAR